VPTKKSNSIKQKMMQPTNDAATAIIQQKHVKLWKIEPALAQNI
jgi:hypothetical protein